MPTAAKSDLQPRWEQRSSTRVLEARRDQILERSRHIVQAAYELLEEEGLDGLTIRVVLKRTGLSRRAFYERFADKDDLMLAVFEYTIRLASEHYSKLLATVSDPMERLQLIVSSIVLGRPSHRRGAAMSREHLRLAQSRPQELQLALSPLIALIAQQLSDGMQAGLVRTCAVQRLAALVYNLVSNTVHTEFLVQQSASPDQQRWAELATDIWEFCRRAIAA
jgi:AcrR family transcriptional regulator